MIRTLCLTTILLIPASAALADAPASPLAQVPASAAIVVHINGLDPLENHVVAFLKNAVPEQAAAARPGIESFLKTLSPGSRPLVGMARDRPVFIVVMQADEKSGQAYVLPIASFKEFRDGYLTPDDRKSVKSEAGYDSFTNGSGFGVYRNGYVILAATKEVAETFAKGPPGLDTKLSKDQADRFLRSDMGLYMDGEAFTKKYADAIKDAHKQINDSLDALEQNAGNLQKEEWETVRGAADVVFQAIDDGQTVLLTGELHPDGASGHAEAMLKPDSKTAAALKESKLSPFRDLPRLPAGQMFYTGRQTGPVLAKLLGLVQFRVVIDPDLDGAKAAHEALDQLIQAGPRSHVQAVALPPASVELWEYDDPQKAVAAQTKLLESLDAGDWYLFGLLKGKPEIKTKVVRYRNMDMTYAHLVFDWDRMLADVPQPTHRLLTAGLQKMAGDSANVWFGTDGRLLVQATGKDWFAAKRQLDQYFASDGMVNKDESFAAVRRELPAEASAVVLIDAVQFTGALLDFLRPLADASGGQGPKLPTIKGKPAFIGAALTLRPERVEGDLFVSADAIKQLYKPLEPFLPFLPF